MNKIDKMIRNIELVDNFIIKQNYTVRCLKGCSDCCYDYFYATLPEFYLTLYGLLKKPSNLEFYYQKALKTSIHFQNHIQSEMLRLDPLSSVRLLENVIEDFNEGEYTNYQNLPECVMLNNGRCSVYKYRPNTCRKYGTLVTCEYLNNRDYQDDEYTNYHIYPLVENTLLIKDGNNMVTQKYPLWFYYSYFFSKEIRPYILETLNKMSTMDEQEFIQGL